MSWRNFRGRSWINCGSPLEDGAVQISRSQQSTVFPALVTLVAATNPCPCGWHGDRDHGCRCSSSQR